MEWETVIGLEVHVQLDTQSKIFSGAAANFGDTPNANACAVDLALPGTLPVINQKAVEYAVMFGLAIGSPICKHSVFERKNYFYPDLPKGYQTSQLEDPIVGPGVISIELDENTSKNIRIHHAHLEEDAGKSVHDAIPGMSGIDLNRAGTPLIEIVSEPDISNAKEAIAFAKKLHSIVTSLGICDGEMSQGSMRFDVNISVRLKGDTELGTRTETKNLNSFKFMEDAIHKEVQRQIEVIEDGGKITQETRLYNGDTGEARSMRSKEEANDYRYFPCPDLLPIELSDDYISAIRESLPELPSDRTKRFMNDYKLSPYDSAILADSKEVSDYFEQVVSQTKDPKLSSNWITGELASKLNTENINIKQAPISTEGLANLINRIKDNTISNKIAKQVFQALWNGEADSADKVIELKGLKQVSDSGAIEQLVTEVITNNPEQVSQYKEADDKKRKKLIGFFVGQIMKASKGQANPAMVNQLLAKALNN